MLLFFFLYFLLLMFLVIFLQFTWYYIFALLVKICWIFWLMIYDLMKLLLDKFQVKQHDIDVVKSRYLLFETLYIKYIFYFYFLFKEMFWKVAEESGKAFVKVPSHWFHRTGDRFWSWLNQRHNEQRMENTLGWGNRNDQSSRSSSWYFFHCKQFFIDYKCLSKFYYTVI